MPGRVGEVLLAFLRLGVTSFGGPVAHLGYFREAFVTRRRWIDEAGYADLVALAQFLPGPSSSQVGFALGVLRGGIWGGVAAWVGFTLPSAVLMLLAAFGVDWAAGRAGSMGVSGAVHGLLLVAVAVVAQAVWGMGSSLCPDRARRTLAAGAAVAMLLLPSGGTAIGVITAGALVGVGLFREATEVVAGTALPVRISRAWAVGALLLFFALLVALPALADATGSHWVAVADAFYRAGSLVFGGGHVVLPLLERAFVPSGWVSADRFLAGYGVAQAVPGPLFTFGAFVGAAEGPWPNGVAGGLLGLVAIFLPGLLLMVGVLPFWDGLRRRAGVRAALMGVNAAVVGVLGAALYDPIWVAGVRGAADLAIVLVAFGALVWWRVPVWVVVLVVAGVGATSA